MQLFEFDTSTIITRSSSSHNTTTSGGMEETGTFLRANMENDIRAFQLSNARFLKSFYTYFSSQVNSNNSSQNNSYNNTTTNNNVFIGTDVII